MFLLHLWDIYTNTVFALTQNDITNNLNTMKNKYPDGSKWCGTYYANDGSTGPWDCFGFACEIFRGVFGCEMPRAYTADMWHFANTNNVVCVGSIEYPTEEQVKNLLSTAKPGDVLQARGGIQHTMIITNASDVGINVFDANYDNNNTVRVDAYLSHYTVASKYYVGLSLYRYKNYPEKTLPDVPTGVLSFAWGDRVQIQWDTVAGADCYECGLIDVNTKNTILKVEVNDWYYNFYNVPEGDYYAYVCSRNSAGDSRHSDWIYTTVKWYRVHYEGSGGNNIPTTQVKYCDKNLQLDSTKPVKEGYKFKNWNTQEDGKGNTYNPGDSYTINNSVTLYAQWERIEPSISATVNSDKNIHTVTAKIENLNRSCKMIVSGYKNGELVLVKTKSYADSGEVFVMTGDIDTIKVMAWDSMQSIKSVCNAKIIKNEDWITE